MKVAIIGTHSTGKSTLLKHLAEALKRSGRSVVVLPELARFCPMPINEATSLEAQVWIQEHQRKQEEQLYTPDTILLCDRATIDNFAYMQRAAMDRDVSAYEGQAVLHMKSYACVFKTRKLPIPAVADGVRTVDEAFRTDIDRRISDLLEDHSIPHTPLSETIEYDVHVQHMMDVIQKTAPQCALSI